MVRSAAARWRRLGPQRPRPHAVRILGHGGRGVANWLANRLHGYVNSSLLTLGGKRGDEAVRKAIDEAFRLANASLRKEVNASFRTGSTAVIAVLLQRTRLRTQRATNGSPFPDVAAYLLFVAQIRSGEAVGQPHL